MEFTVLSSPDESVDSYSALLRFDTTTAASRASREVTQFNPGATVVTGNYLAISFGNKLDRAACIRAIQLAGRYPAGAATPEESIFSLMRSYPGRDRVGELVRREGIELNRRFRQFLSMYLPGAEYECDVTFGLDALSRWIRFTFTYGQTNMRICFINYNDGVENIHLHCLDANRQTKRKFRIPSTDTIQDLASQLSRETR